MYICMYLFFFPFAFFFLREEGGAVAVFGGWWDGDGDGDGDARCVKKGIVYRQRKTVCKGGELIWVNIFLIREGRGSGR